jgi:hypothetical protein
MVLVILNVDWKDDSPWSDGRSKGGSVDSLLLQAIAYLLQIM